ncbi:MAG: CoA transferase [Sphingobium sp.]
MTRPLEGITVVEVATWAFVPVAGAILSDMGAEVIKIEASEGDPSRVLVTRLGNGAPPTVNFTWESYNRGKKSLTLDLRQEAGRAALYRLLEGADVFLTNLLPPAHARMGIDAETLGAKFPRLIYATGSAVGHRGPQANKGGYDSISFWARGGVSSMLTEDGVERPVGPPGPAFGDTLSGSMLAGGICAAIARRAMTGEADTVDVSLLGGAMWAMQRAIVQATDENVDRFARPPADLPNNVLSNTYRTSDDRFLALCMLQADKYWARLCELIGRPDMASDPRYVDAAARRTNVRTCVEELNAVFAARPLEEWRGILAQQDGQWDVVQHVGELCADEQVRANGLIQSVPSGTGRDVPIVSVPMQFGGVPLPTRPAPELGADSDAILGGIGYDEDEIIALKVAGVVL